jgi:hypothetical protein
MPKWFDRAECRTTRDVSVFFPDVERGHYVPTIWERAREMCERCTVRLECLNFQMEFEERTGRRDGMWGGLTPKERDLLAHERMKPRP